VRSEVGAVATTHQRRVTHQVADIALPVRGGGVEVAPLRHPDQVRHLHRKVGAAVETREASRRNPAKDLAQFFERHGPDALVYIVGEPGYRRRPPAPHRRRIAVQALNSSRGELADDAVAAAIEGRAVHARSIRHDAAMAASALVHRQRQALGGGHPAQADNGAVRLRACPHLRQGIRRTGHGDQVGVVAARRGYVQLAKHRPPRADPLR